MSEAISQIIIDFVEIECAHINTVFDPDQRKKLPRLRRIANSIRPIRRFLFRNFPHRDPELGLNFIDWHISQKDQDPDLGEDYSKPWEELKNVYEYFKTMEEISIEDLCEGSFKAIEIYEDKLFDKYEKNSTQEKVNGKWVVHLGSMKQEPWTEKEKAKYLKLVRNWMNQVKRAEQFHEKMLIRAVKLRLTHGLWV